VCMTINTGFQKPFFSSRDSNAPLPPLPPQPFDQVAQLAQLQFRIDPSDQEGSLTVRRPPPPGEGPFPGEGGW